MHPFIKKIGPRLFIKLHKDLYPADLIDKIIKEEPDAISSIKKKRNYTFLELNAEHRSDYFDFLNYLIYHKKNQ